MPLNFKNVPEKKKKKSSSLQSLVESDVFTLQRTADKLIKSKGTMLYVDFINTINALETFRIDLPGIQARQ